MKLVQSRPPGGSQYQAVYPTKRQKQFARTISDAEVQSAPKTERVLVYAGQIRMIETLQSYLSRVLYAVYVLRSRDHRDVTAANTGLTWAGTALRTLVPALLPSQGRSEAWEP
jgi:hypothetical protein